MVNDSDNNPAEKKAGQEFKPEELDPIEEVFTPVKAFESLELPETSTPDENFAGDPPETEPVAVDILETPATNLAPSPYQKVMPFYDLGDLLKVTSPNIDWVWEKLIGRKQITAIYGPGKHAGKSTLISHLIYWMNQVEYTDELGLIIPPSFLGLRTKKCWTLLLSEEGTSTLIQKYGSFIVGLDKGVTVCLKPYVLPTLPWIAQPGNPNVSILDAIEKIIDEERTRGRDIGMIAIDPFIEWTNIDDENSAVGANRAIRPLRILAEKKNVAIVLLHHESKVGTIRGSTAIQAAVDTVIHLNQIKDSKDPTTRRLSIVSWNVDTPSEILCHLEEDLAGMKWYKLYGRTDNKIEQELIDELKKKPCTRDELEALIGGDKNQASRQVSEFLKDNEKRLSFTGKGVKGDPKLWRWSDVKEEVVNLMEIKQTSTNPKEDDNETNGDDPFE